MSLAKEVTVERIIETFELLPDWENRYQFLDELGTRLDPMDESDKTDGNRVMECMSILHIMAKPGERQGLIDFDADCNTSTIKGTITSGHPSRIRLKVPSKSNSTCSGGRRAARSATISMRVPGRKRVAAAPSTTGR